MSFAALARHLKELYTVVAFDFRGHGENLTENETDMSEETLINDALVVVKHVCQQYSDRSVIMVGHSMGGSIATKATAKIHQDFNHEEWSKQI
jgi:protein phosphatase methylesterase 1